MKTEYFMFFTVPEFKSRFAVPEFEDRFSAPRFEGPEEKVICQSDDAVVR
jgi:hypothetical protein